jgi:hypothetical protein
MAEAQPIPVMVTRYTEQVLALHEAKALLRLHQLDPAVYKINPLLALEVLERATEPLRTVRSKPVPEAKDNRSMLDRVKGKHERDPEEP